MTMCDLAVCLDFSKVCNILFQQANYSSKSGIRLAWHSLVLTHAPIPEPCYNSLGSIDCLFSKLFQYGPGNKDPINQPVIPCQFFSPAHTSPHLTRLRLLVSSLLRPPCILYEFLKIITNGKEIALACPLHTLGSNAWLNIVWDFLFLSGVHFYPSLLILTLYCAIWFVIKYSKCLLYVKSSIFQRKNLKRTFQLVALLIPQDMHPCDPLLSFYLRFSYNWHSQKNQPMKQALSQEHKNSKCRYIFGGPGPYILSLSRQLHRTMLSRNRS